jgi:hypothetical protein
MKRTGNGEYIHSIKGMSCIWLMRGRRLMQMFEIEREDILAQRLEEMQRIQDKRNLDQMLKGVRTDADSVSKAAKCSCVF